MAVPKRKALQVEVRSDDEWSQLLQQPGMLVVDAYAAWCGPCTAIRSLLNKIKIFLDREDLVFATAETDSIGSLSAYRNKSEPTFLFYGGGVLVNVVRGCNAPKINKAIKTMLSEEDKIAEGIFERKEFFDAVVAQKVEEKSDDMKEDEEEEEEEEEAADIAYGVVLVKPDAAAAVEDIVTTVAGAGFEIVHRVERTLTSEEVGELHRDAEGSDTFEELIALMTSGPCVALALTKGASAVTEETIAELGTLVGSSDVNTAKEEAPESLRALFGTDSLHNAVSCSASVEEALRDTVFFFQHLAARKTPRQKSSRPKVETTVAMIFSNATAHKDSILQVIGDNGFRVSLQKEITLSKEQVETLNVTQKEEEGFESIVMTMTAGPSMILALEKVNAVEAWHQLLSPPLPPTTEGDGSEGGAAAIEGLQAKYARPEDSCPPLHGSVSVAEAARELDLLFPQENAVVVIQPEVSEETRESILTKLQQEGLEVLSDSSLTLTEEQVSLLYTEVKDEPHYAELVTLMTSGPSSVYVLLSRDANATLQGLLGPTDPAEAQEENPASIRAMYGETIVKNVAYGSGGSAHALELVKSVLPDVEIEDDGLVFPPAVVEDQVDGDTAEPLPTADGAAEAVAVADGDSEAVTADETAPTEETLPETSDGANVSDGNGDAPTTSEDTAGETGAETAATEAISDGETKVGEINADVPTSETATESGPATEKDDSPSADGIVNEAPAEEVASEATGQDEALTEGTADLAPTAEAPAEEAPAKEESAEGTPSEKAPIDEPSAEQSPVEVTPPQSTEDAPAESEATEEVAEDKKDESAASDEGETIAAETSRETTLDEQPSATESSLESSAVPEEGSTSVEASREGTLVEDETTVDETSRETTMDGQTTTEVSREGTTTEVSDTDATATDAATD